MKLTHEQLKNLKPCRSQYEAAIKALGSDFTADALEARAKGVSMSDVIWVASAMAKKDKSIERKIRMWMADCAARVLPIYEKTGSSAAPRNAIIAARQFANGEIDDAAWAAARDAAWAAARAAAWAAAGAAARDAAWDAAWAAAWAAAGAAARDAAGDAAGDAAWDAAWAAAGDAARDAAWDAAWAAAGDAARDAARDAAWAAARDAARDAAGAAARAAAGAAACAAEEKWQYTRLCEWLSDNEPQPVEIGEK